MNLTKFALLKVTKFEFTLNLTGFTVSRLWRKCQLRKKQNKHMQDAPVQVGIRPAGEVTGAADRKGQLAYLAGMAFL